MQFRLSSFTQLGFNLCSFGIVRGDSPQGKGAELPSQTVLTGKWQLKKLRLLSESMFCMTPASHLQAAGNSCVVTSVRKKEGAQFCTSSAEPLDEAKVAGGARRRTWCWAEKRVWENVRMSARVSALEKNGRHTP